MKILRFEAELRKKLYNPEASICFCCIYVHCYVHFFLGFHIIIPSKLEAADLKTICREVGYSEETCLLWPKGYNKKGLQDKHMPYIMWNLASKLRWVMWSNAMSRVGLLTLVCLMCFI
jgi:hypothetical protein